MQKDVIRLHHYITTEGEMIAITFPMEEPYKTLVKQLNGRRWCATNKWVYVKRTPENLREIFSKFKGVAWIDGRDYFNGVNRSTSKQSIVQIINCAQRKQTFINLPSGAKPEWTEKLKRVENAYHIIKTGHWAIPGSNENFRMMKEYFIAQGCMVKVKNISKLKVEKKPATNKWYYGKPIDLRCMQDFKDMLALKRLSPNTAKCYISMFARFLAYFGGKDINALAKTDIVNYILWEIRQNGISATIQNQLINAVKYYYEKVQGRPREIYDLPRPKTVKNEPVVLNNEELQKILSGIKNIKHRCIMSLLFSAGLRRQELLNLKVHDIDMERKVISIHKGKGNKDRISILAETTARHINEYVLQYKPKCWLFEGQAGGQYSAESVWKIFDRLKKRYSIWKKGNVHLLRHTFATNLLEAGTDIRYIQKLLGHCSIKTTEVYTHIANNNLLKIKSPIDQLGI
jgi:site-specific recombinase XerD